MGWAGSRLRARRATRRLTSVAQSGARAGASASRGAGRVVQRLTRASGAGRTGLSNLIELTAAGSAADAFVAVALAGTLFFSASVDQARGRVALALVVTMAPFAVLAPLIGPMLDRVQDGRRYILAGTLLARGLLCWGMSGAVFHHDTVTLLPAAFGVLVLQKAFGVTRSAVTPRLLPREITLVTANARAGLASLIASTVGVLIAGGIVLAAGGGSAGAAWALRVGTVIYLAATAPTRPLDGAAAPTRPQAGRPYATQPEAPPAGRAPGQDAGQAAGRDARRGNGAEAPRSRTRWRTLGQLGPIVGEAMRANATLRAFSGFMVFFLAFLLRTVHFPGVPDKVALAEMIAAAAAGGFLGSLTGSALRTQRPQIITLGLLAAATVVTALCAVFFGLWATLVVALFAAFGQVLSKLALDSTVQHEIGEGVRSSAFAVSETLNQLSWVAGGLAGVLLSLTNSGVIGLTVAAAGLAISFILLVLHRRRRILAARRRPSRPPRPPRRPPASDAGAGPRPPASGMSGP